MKRALLLGAGALLGLSGCLDPQMNWFKSEPSPSQPADKKTVTTKAEIIGDVSPGIANAEPIAVSGVGLVVGLDGTGGTPPGGFREALKEQLLKAGRDNVNELLASRDNALVLVSALIPPGAKRGDTIDIEVTLPPGSKATSLRGGTLLECQLYNFDSASNVRRHLAQQGDYQPSSTADGLLMGHPLVKAKGPLLTGIAKSSVGSASPAAGSAGSDSSSSAGQESVANGLDDHKFARVWGGGRCQIDRPFYLELGGEFANGRSAMHVADRINETFHGPQPGADKIADPKPPQIVALKVPPQYRLNLPRFLRVVRMIPLVRAAPDSQYVRDLEADLLDPGKTITAALRLEAVGKESIRVLKSALQSPYPLVRFSSAEALAYLGDPTGGRELAALAIEHPSLRAYCLTALAALDEGISYEKLQDLLAHDDPDLRYGAFRALTVMDPKSQLAKGQVMNRSFTLHRVADGSSSMVHLLTGKKAEVVIFGESPQLMPPFSILVGPDFTVTAGPDDRKCTIGRFSVKHGKEQRQCSFDLTEIVQNLAEMGATYPDIVELLRKADDAKSLSCRLCIDALPQAASVQALAAAGKDDPTLARSNAELRLAHQRLGETPTLYQTQERPPIRRVAKAEAAEER